MFAVIKLSGKQYLVQEKDVFRTEKVPTEAGKEFEVNDVLLVEDKGLRIGAPRVEGASVMLKVRSHGKAKKILVFKMKSKKRYRRKKGHRQLYTEVEVTKIKASK